jgi:hypothetical protein
MASTKIAMQVAVAPVGTMASRAKPSSVVCRQAARARVRHLSQSSVNCISLFILNIGY